MHMTMASTADRASQHFTVQLWLKPHLHDMVKHICRGDVVVADERNAIGSLVQAVLTPKPEHAYETTPDFKNGRRQITARITNRNAQRHGFTPTRMAQFEVLVEHFFYHKLLAWVDALIADGVSQNEAIRRFLDHYEIDTASIEFDSLKKTITRRRSGMHQAETKFSPDVSPRKKHD